MQKNNEKSKTERIDRLSEFHLELDKTVLGLSLSITGVEGISAFSDTEIIVSLSSFSLRIVGKGLYMSVFEEKCVEILGKISGVNILYGKS